jgi:hypothetical protein
MNPENEKSPQCGDFGIVCERGALRGGADDFGEDCPIA